MDLRGHSVFEVQEPEVPLDVRPPEGGPEPVRPLVKDPREKQEGHREPLLGTRLYTLGAVSSSSVSDSGPLPSLPLVSPVVVVLCPFPCPVYTPTTEFCGSGSLLLGSLSRASRP